MTDKRSNKVVVFPDKVAYIRVLQLNTYKCIFFFLVSKK